MDFNFDDLKMVTFSNRKASSNFTVPQIPFEGLRYRTVKQTRKDPNDESKKIASEVSKFFVAEKKFETLNLKERGLVQFVHPTDKTKVFLAVVNNDDAVILRNSKKGEKGSSFKSDAMEEALVNAGIINKEDKAHHQLIELEEVGSDKTIGGVYAHKVFLLVKGERIPITKKTKKAEGPTDAGNTVPETSQNKPVDAPAPAQAAKSEWD